MNNQFLRINKEQARAWAISGLENLEPSSDAVIQTKHFEAFTDALINEIFKDEPEKFVPTFGLTYQFSDYSDFRQKVELNFTNYDPTDPVMYGTKYLPWKYCRPVTEELRTKYGE